MANNFEDLLGITSTELKQVEAALAKSHTAATSAAPEVFAATEAALKQESFDRLQVIEQGRHLRPDHPGLPCPVQTNEAFPAALGAVGHPVHHRPVVGLVREVEGEHQRGMRAGEQRFDLCLNCTHHSHSVTSRMTTLTPGTAL